MTAACRWTLRRVGSPAAPDGFARAVAEGLSAAPKRIPCRFLYDERGSMLFEEISRLPEYYLTRAEREILERHAEEIVGGQGAAAFEIVELGSGSAEKTRILIEAVLRLRTRARYIPVDIARHTLEESCAALAREYPRLEVHAIEGSYSEAMDVLPAPEGPRMVAWLGSSIGNFEDSAAADFLARAARAIGDGGCVLVGCDLAKDPEVLRAAYCDAAGVTEKFIRNILERVNRELGGEFRQQDFAYVVEVEPGGACVRMWLESRRTHEVRIRRVGCAFRFERGERIHIEDSHKYTRERIARIAAAAGLKVERAWSDSERRFLLWRAHCA